MESQVLYTVREDSGLPDSVGKIFNGALVSNIIRKCM